MDRRDFMKIISAGAVIIGKPYAILASLWEKGEKNYWDNGKFSQRSICLANIDRDIIRARIDNTWMEYKVKKLPSGFIEWNFNSRLNSLKAMREGTGGFSLTGPHCGMVATYGSKRKDSVFTLNNAVKGIGFAPSGKRVEELIKYMENHLDDSPQNKLDWLIGLYEDHDNFDLRAQTSLELYVEKDFETHTFLNIMENPVATIVFLDNQSFEVRTIARILHPEDKNTSKYEKALLKYVNLIHSFFHGRFDKIFPLLTFYCVEVFDNSPGRKKGVRILPSLT